LPFVEIRAGGDEGYIPRDDETMGELEVAGPWVSKAYYNALEEDDKPTDGGFVVSESWV